MESYLLIPLLYPETEAQLGIMWETWSSQHPVSLITIQRMGALAGENWQHGALLTPFLLADLIPI